jgi:phosphatidate cytidylyltransferase
MTPAPARRILRRTLTGGTLMLAVALLLVWTARSEDGRPIFFAVAAILLGAILEASRMGTLAMRDLFPTLLLPAAGAVTLLLAAIEGASGTPHGYRPNLLLEYLWIGALGACAHALSRALPRAGGSIRGISRLLVYLVLGWIVVFTTGDTLAVSANLKLSFLVLAVLLAVTIPIVARQPRGLPALLSAVGLVLWLVPPLPALWRIWSTWSTGGLVAFLVCAKIGDTAAYYVGTAVGRHHPFPRISPGKTLEGCIGSFAVGTAAGGAAVAAGFLPGGIAGGLAAGALVNLAAQAGDLLESWIKRRVGVKDSSTWFGPSGGILDQLDSLFLGIPVAVATWPWLLGAAGRAH